MEKFQVLLWINQNLKQFILSINGDLYSNESFLETDIKTKNALKRVRFFV